MNRDHSIVFKIPSKYCISDSFIDYDGYSISSKGFLTTVAAWHWSDCKEITHVQWQRSPSKMVGTSTVAAQCWSNFEEIPHVQGQRRSPSKTVGGVKSHLESNPIPSQRHSEGSNKMLCIPGDAAETRCVCV